MLYNSNNVVFKDYNNKQDLLFPPNLSDLIPENDLVRVIDRVIEMIDITPILSSYKGGGTSSFHPRMLLKVVIYGYTQRITSCRAIAFASTSDIERPKRNPDSLPLLLLRSRFGRLS